MSYRFEKTGSCFQGSDFPKSYIQTRLPSHVNHNVGVAPAVHFALCASVSPYSTYPTNRIFYCICSSNSYTSILILGINRLDRDHLHTRMYCPKLKKLVTSPELLKIKLLSDQKTGIRRQAEPLFFLEQKKNVRSIFNALPVGHHKQLFSVFHPLPFCAQQAFPTFKSKMSVPPETIQVKRIKRTASDRDAQEFAERRDDVSEFDGPDYLRAYRHALSCLR